MEMIDNVRSQTYRPLEQIIVSDGPDPELRDIIAMIQRESGPDEPPITFAELGRNTSTALTDSMSAVPFATAVWMAHGDLIAWWSDDERAEPDHLEGLVNLLEETGVDFVYPKVRIWRKGQPERRWIVGEYPPYFGTITHVVHRWDILDVVGGQFRPHVGRANDWAQIAAWLAAGKTCAMLDRVTFEHRIDE